MVPVLVGGAIVIGVFAWLSAGENKARQEFEHSQERLKSQLKDMNRDLKRAKHYANESLRFEKHIALYYASIAQANSQYKDYEAQKHLVKLVKAKRVELGTKIGELKALKQTLKGKERQKVVAELNMCYEWLEQIKAEQSRLYDKKADLLEQLRQINHNTHEIKCYLRKNCGKGGRNWYKQKFLS